MSDKTQRDEIIAELALINAQFAKQNSIRRVFMMGIIYGVGFFVGSVILATIAFGIFGPIFSRVQWLHQSYEAGATLRR